MRDTTTYCDGCNGETATIHGRCARCWYLKTPSAVPAQRRYQQPLWHDDDLASFVWRALSWAPGLVVLALGLILEMPTLIGVGGGLLAVRLIAALIAGDYLW